MEYTPSPKLERLEPLIGEWSMEAVFPKAPASDLRGRAVFEWGPNRGFAVQRWEVPIREAPDGLAVLAADPETEDLVQHYFDSRGVVRRYEMSVEADTWALERLAPGFCQRFVGRFAAGGDRIEGSWEMSEDGSRWKHDFALIYTKV